jgi:hypothetical protein
MLDMRFFLSGSPVSRKVRKFCLAQISLNSIIITNVINADWHGSKIGISFCFGGDSSLSVVDFFV